MSIYYQDGKVSASVKIIALGQLLLSLFCVRKMKNLRVASEFSLYLKSTMAVLAPHSPFWHQSKGREKKQGLKKGPSFKQSREHKYRAQV